jgi:DNA invertase Pin-like site-specific DNA recombinase
MAERKTGKGGKQMRIFKEPELSARLQELYDQQKIDSDVAKEAHVSKCTVRDWRKWKKLKAHGGTGWGWYRRNGASRPWVEVGK